MHATSEAPRSAPGWRTPALILFGGAVLFAAGLFNPVIDDKGHKILGAIVACVLTVVVFLVWLWWTVRKRGGRAHLLLAAAVCVAISGFAATMRADFGGDLHVSFRPRNWVLNVARRLHIDVGDVIHADRLVDPPLVIEPTAYDSPKFLGPDGDGRYRFEPGRPAVDWSARPPREVWRVKIGPAWSSFAVVGRYGFTQQQTTDLVHEQTACYDLTDGALQWVSGDTAAFVTDMGGDGPRATPTYFQGRLVSVGARGLLNCFEASTGRRIWSRNPVEESNATIPEWGVSSSPLIFHSERHGDVVVLSAGGTSGNSLHAYRLDDGKEVWSVGNDPPGYVSPALQTIGGVKQIVLVNWQAVSGHDPDTGAELWRFEDPHQWVGNFPKVPQPIVLDDRRVLISAGYGTGCIMLDVAKDADGKWMVASKWRTTKLKPKFSNPVVRDGFIYGLDDGAFLVCLDLADGNLKWRSNRGADYGHGQILLLDDLILVQSETGEVALVAADPKEYRELTRFTALPVGKSWNQPVVAGRRLLVRNDREAACFELPAE